MLATLWPVEVGDVLDERLAELGMSLADLVRATGISDETIRRVRRGDAVAPSSATKRAIAKAMLWPPDWWEQIQRGERPQTVDTALPDGTAASGIPDILDGLSAEDRARVQGYIDALRARRHHD